MITIYLYLSTMAQEENFDVVKLSGKFDTLGECLENMSVITVDDGGKTESINPGDAHSKAYSICCFRNRFAYWNTVAYCAPYPLYSVDEVRHLAEFYEGNRSNLISWAWWKEDTDKSFVYTNYNLLANLAAGSIDEVRLLQKDGSFKKTKFVYTKE